MLRCSISLYCGIFKKLRQEKIKLINSLENKFKQIKEYIQQIVCTNLDPKIVSRIDYSFSQINEIVELRKIIKIETENENFSKYYTKTMEKYVKIAKYRIEVKNEEFQHKQSYKTDFGAFYQSSITPTQNIKNYNSIVNRYSTINFNDKNINTINKSETMMTN